MDLTPAQRTATHRISALIQELADLVGPAFDGDVDEGIPMASPVLTGWVLVSNWEDIGSPDEGASITRITSDGMRRAERTGLLHEALFGME